MKIRVLMLSMFVLFLSVKPMVELLFSQTQTDACCKAKEDSSPESQSQEQRETSCNDLCSPFQPCCPYFTLSVSQLALTIPKRFPTTGSPLPIYQASFKTGYLTDFWQPPKTV